MSNRRKAKDLASQQFYKFDKWILAEESLRKLSPTAKLLYMVLRDREEISLKNSKDFTDKDGCVYQYFDQEKASLLLGVGLSAIKKAFKDLQDYKLVESVRQGQGKPNRLYILDFKVSEDTLKELSYENKKVAPAPTSTTNNKTNSSNNIISNTNKKYTGNNSKSKNKNGIKCVNNTFDKYDPDELERRLLEKQREKFEW